MGRDKPKKFSKMGYFEKEAYKDEMAKKYGIQGTEYRDGRGNTQYRRNDKALKLRCVMTMTTVQVLSIWTVLKATASLVTSLTTNVAL